MNDICKRTQKDKAMNATLRNILIAIVLTVVTIIVALIAIMTDSSSTHTIDGKTYVNTTQGVQELKDVEYMAQMVAFAMPAPIMPVTHNTASIIPAELPHASVAYGEFNCTGFNHNVQFTYTSTTPCDK